MKETVPVRSTSNTAGDRTLALNASGFPVQGLMDFMAESITVFSTLQRVLLEEKEGLLLSNASHLEQRNLVKEDVVSTIGRLDERRSALWQEIGACIGRDPTSLTLSDLLEEGPMAHSSEFRSSLSTMSGLLSNVRKLNTDNRDLVLGALNLIKGSISLLTGLLNGQGIYQRSGAIGMGNQGGKFLSGAA